MRTIGLTQGYITIVDDDDFPRLNEHKWCVLSLCTPGRFYAQRRSNDKILLMHRVILRPDEGLLVDHINGNGLDNRRSNLRPATRHQNAVNTRRVRGFSRFKGVVRNRTKWQAQIGKESSFLGCYETEEEAAHAYDKAAIERYGEFAMTNLRLGLLAAIPTDGRDG